jgi:hypothetical protein
MFIGSARAGLQVWISLKAMEEDGNDLGRVGIRWLPGADSTCCQLAAIQLASQRKSPNNLSSTSSTTILEILEN